MKNEKEKIIAGLIVIIILIITPNIIKEDMRIKAIKECISYDFDYAISTSTGYMCVNIGHEYCSLGDGVPSCIEYVKEMKGK